MRIVPWGRVVIESPLTAEDSVNALRAALGAPGSRRSLQGPPGAAALKGTVMDTRFKLCRERGLLWWNSFEPIIEGYVEGCSAGSRIKGIVRVSRLVAVIMATWLGTVGFVLLISVAAAVRGGWDEEGATGILLLLLMFSLGYALCMWGFWGSVPRLRSIVEACVRGHMTRSES